jgi:hypothetical protein
MFGKRIPGRQGASLAGGWQMLSKRMTGRELFREVMFRPVARGCLHVKAAAAESL